MSVAARTSLPGDFPRLNIAFVVILALSLPAVAQDTAKPVLLGKHWVAVTGKPLGATAGAATFQKGGNAVDAAAGKSRKEAIYAAYDRFYRGDIAEEIVRATREHGGLFTNEDLANREVKIEEPVSTDYRGIDVYKLTTWTQGPVLLQTLNILEGFDLQAMGYNATRYIHTLYQAMNLAFADRDFYYGDPYFPPAEPVEGLLSKKYAAQRRKLIPADHNLSDLEPGDPYGFQGGTNPYEKLRQQWTPEPPDAEALGVEGFQQANVMSHDEGFMAGTTSIQAAEGRDHIQSYQMQSSFGAHQAEPGRLQVSARVQPYTREQLKRMGYKVEVEERVYNPTTAIWFDHEEGTMQGGASDYGDDYGIAW